MLVLRGEGAGAVEPCVELRTASVGACTHLWVHRRELGVQPSPWDVAEHPWAALCRTRACKPEPRNLPRGGMEEPKNPNFTIKISIIFKHPCNADPSLPAWYFLTLRSWQQALGSSVGTCPAVPSRPFISTIKP